MLNGLAVLATDRVNMLEDYLYSEMRVTSDSQSLGNKHWWMWTEVIKTGHTGFSLGDSWQVTLAEGTVKTAGNAGH
jgi:hypothetical protein